MCAVSRYWMDQKKLLAQDKTVQRKFAQLQLRECQGKNTRKSEVMLMMGFEEHLPTQTF